MLGICQARGIPVISLVRSEASLQSLKELGSRLVVSQSDPDFDSKLEKMAEELKATAVFDGVGGELIGRVAKVLPRGSTIYAYGFIAGDSPLGFPSSLLLWKALTMTYFGNFFSSTVREPERLRRALEELGELAKMPHFKTRIAKRFSLEEIDTAMDYPSFDSLGKAVLCPFKLP